MIAAALEGLPSPAGVSFAALILSASRGLGQSQILSRFRRTLPELSRRLSGGGVRRANDWPSGDPSDPSTKHNVISLNAPYNHVKDSAPA